MVDLETLLGPWRLATPAFTEIAHRNRASRTWWVDSERGRHVAKLAFDRRCFVEPGLRVAAAVTEVGIATGCPVPTEEGDLCLEVDRGAERPWTIALLEHRLHPWSSYLVVPIFALASAGVPLGSGALGTAAGSRLTWAVILGLVGGKICGITVVTWGATRTGAGRLPPGVGMSHVFGASALGGIGFTVSLFIAGLAFTSEELQMQAKIGILAGSLIAAIVGVAILLGQSAPAEDDTVPTGEKVAV